MFISNLLSWKSCKEKDYRWRGQLKRIKYEIRLSEPNRPMSTGPKKVEPILYVGPLTKRRPRLAHQVSDSWKLAPQGEDLLCKDETCSTRRKLALQGWDLLSKDETCSIRRRLALQGWDLLHKNKTCSTRRKLALQGWDLLHKDETCSTRGQDLTTIKSPNILIKRYVWLTPL